jgi:hypothetical protein
MLVCIAELAFAIGAIEEGECIRPLTENAGKIIPSASKQCEISNHIKPKINW